MTAGLDISAIREQYPAFARTQDGRPVVFFDGPAGSQVPQRVIDAASHALGYVNANTHGEFVTAYESDAMLVEAHAAMADLLGTDDPNLIAFGPNMTTLTLGLSRALSRTWGPGDEIVVTGSVGKVCPAGCWFYLHGGDELLQDVEKFFFILGRLLALLPDIHHVIYR